MKFKVGDAIEVIGGNCKGDSGIIRHIGKMKANKIRELIGGENSLWSDWGIRTSLSSLGRADDPDTWIINKIEIIRREEIIYE